MAGAAGVWLIQTLGTGHRQLPLLTFMYII